MPTFQEIRKTKSVCVRSTTLAKATLGLIGFFSVGGGFSSRAHVVYCQHMVSAKLRLVLSSRHTRAFPLLQEGVEFSLDVVEGVFTHVVHLARFPALLPLLG